MVQVFRGVRRVLRKDATLWLNLGDSYLAGKQLGGIPWRVAFAIQSDGWILRQDCIWHKPSPMPSSVTDRCTTAHEFIFLLAKSERYFYDAEAIKEQSQRGGQLAHYSSGNGSRATAMGKLPSGNEHPDKKWTATVPHSRNRRSVWKVSAKPYKGAHFATFPPDLIEPCILAGTSAEGCCSNCRAPLIRQTSKTKLKRSRPNAYTKRTHEEGTGNACANDVAGVAVETLGWAPSCDCAAEVIPCAVLDPFAGSGATLQVARHHGRNGVGIELNPDYIELAKARIMQPLKVKKGK
jgi:DNA modification methylase